MRRPHTLVLATACLLIIPSPLRGQPTQPSPSELSHPTVQRLHEIIRAVTGAENAPFAAHFPDTGWTFIVGEEAEALDAYAVLQGVFDYAWHYVRGDTTEAPSFPLGVHIPTTVVCAARLSTPTANGGMLRLNDSRVFGYFHVALTDGSQYMSIRRETIESGRDGGVDRRDRILTVVDIAGMRPDGDRGLPEMDNFETDQASIEELDHLLSNAALNDLRDLDLEGIGVVVIDGPWITMPPVFVRRALAAETAAFMQGFEWSCA